MNAQEKCPGMNKKRNVFWLIPKCFKQLGSYGIHFVTF